MEKERTNKKMTKIQFKEWIETESLVQKCQSRGKANKGNTLQKSRACKKNVIKIIVGEYFEVGKQLREEKRRQTRITEFNIAKKQDVRSQEIWKISN